MVGHFSSSLLTLTEAAAEQVRGMIEARSKKTAGVRVVIRSRGCSGLSYALEFADAPLQDHERIDCKGFALFIEPKATMFLLGTEMDYVKSDLEEGFVFRNPNEKGRCGCGESFHV